MEHWDFYKWFIPALCLVVGAVLYWNSPPPHKPSVVFMTVGGLWLLMNLCLHCIPESREA
jgi:hypothetical protein